MKKKDVINLIKYFAEKNEKAFKVEAYKIANEFESTGDYQLSQYIMSLLSGDNNLVPQSLQQEAPSSTFWTVLPSSSSSLVLPTPITNDLIGLVNAITRNMGLHIFLFVGEPGTGKTEAAKHMGRLLNRQILRVEMPALVDSKLGQTAKNIQALRREIVAIPNPNEVILLFDEIDMIAMDRTNVRDVREMGRVTSTMLSFLDELPEQIVLIGTSNLHNYFDKAFLRRFDATISFDRYSQSDLADVAVNILDTNLKEHPEFTRHMRLVKKILLQGEPSLPMPGDLKNIIRTSLAFSEPTDSIDYIRKLYVAIHGDIPTDMQLLKKLGYTLRDIEVLTQASKSTVSRKLHQGG